MVPSLMSLGALKPYGDSLGERSSELLRICLLRTLTPLRGIQDQICTSLVRVMAPCSGGLGAGWPYWLPFGWAGKAGGREWANSRKVWTQFWEGCCASTSFVRFQALPVPRQWQPVLFPLPGFTGNLPTPKRRLLVKAFFGGEMGSDCLSYSLL